ncbi:MAG: histidine phosphatase family protein, partial [Elusimicrobia bacterium]|nr:histidine phosphatase family protein [Elusimicrobiota bacterium]
FIVRHAERVSLTDDASLLSAAGKKRAQELKRVLAGVPLKTVYCTEYKRTQQTAAPAAEGHGLKAIVTDSGKTAELVETLKKVSIEEDVLVVGHTDTIPELLSGLGVPGKFEIPKTEFDNLFVVTPREGKAPLFHRLRYGR